MSPAIPDLLEDAGPVCERLAAGSPSLVALDFDGTLTEIVDDPAAPRLTPERRRILARIPAPARRLAIVSGRALADVRERVGIEDAFYVGNHGLEIAAPGAEAEDSPAAELAERLAGLLEEIELPRGTFVEDKRLTATVHVRPRDHRDLHARIGRALGPRVEEAGFRLRPGKAAWEIRPVAARDKGAALRALIERIPGATPATTLYAGDDVTDEDAFRAIPEGVTVRVGADGVETAARYRLDSPAAVYRFLAILSAG